MKIAVPAETTEGESRVAATPDSVKRLIALGASVAVEKGAGMGSLVRDADYEEAGATVDTRDKTLADADVVLTVQRPADDIVKALKSGAILAGILDPYGARDALTPLAKSGAVAFAMEFMPRITRAQSMDVLSSQANIAGYQAIVEASHAYGRALPMMMTAAGTVPAAKVFVMGAGVAGLQAIATARRLGAVVTATDVRPAAKEQVESLGGKFIAVEDEEFKQAETAGGYAKEMSDEYKAKQAELVAGHIAKQNIVVTTALIPGRPAPVLVSKDMVESMGEGGVIVDLAVERGGNCEVSKLGETVVHNGVKIVGKPNLAGEIAATASSLYARNLVAFLDILVDKEKGELAIDWEDEIVTATALTKDGDFVHPALQEKGDGDE